VRKYRNVPTTYDGIRFASKREAGRYLVLKAMQEGGLIAGLQTQPPFRLEVNGYLICKYVADFRYVDVATGREVIEDAKGVRTQAYKLKKKLMLAIHGIDVREV
jgi:hypothetical protein